MPIGADKGEALGVGLGDQEAIEGVAVVQWQRPDAVGMARGDGQEVHTGPFQLIEQIVRGLELAEAALDRH